MQKIVVIGSLATDYVVTSVRRPKVGETIFGQTFTEHFGGKGANQAVAAARLGKAVEMIGAVGQDAAGQKIIEHLQENKVGTNLIQQLPTETGSAHITIADHDNSIIVVPGANAQFQLDLADPLITSTMEKAAIVLLQNEIPQKENEKIIEFCAARQVPILYNPAPFRPLAAQVIDQVSFLTPNEQECADLFNANYEEALRKYPDKLIVTLGAAGAAFSSSQKICKVSAFLVEPLDTTGAGDTFNAAFAVGIISKMPIAQALRFACFASALSIQKAGAQEGMPTLAEMKASPFWQE